MTAVYANPSRMVDHRGILHLGRGEMLAGEALCGWPPIGVRPSDPGPRIYPPGAWTCQYFAICGTCNDAAFRPTERERND